MLKSKASSERAGSYQQPAPTPFEVPNMSQPQAQTFESGDLGEFAEIPADDVFTVLSICIFLIKGGHYVGEKMKEADAAEEAGAGRAPQGQIFITP